MTRACTTVDDADLFFDRRRSATAVRVCMTCAARVSCALDALEAERGEQYVYGVFGGLVAEERRRLNQRRQQAHNAAQEARG